MDYKCLPSRKVQEIRYTWKVLLHIKLLPLPSEVQYSFEEFHARFSLFPQIHHKAVHTDRSGFDMNLPTD